MPCAGRSCATRRAGTEEAPPRRVPWRCACGGTAAPRAPGPSSPAPLPEAHQAGGRNEKDEDQQHHADAVLVRRGYEHRGEGLDEPEEDAAEHRAPDAAQA